MPELMIYVSYGCFEALDTCTYMPFRSCMGSHTHRHTYTTTHLPTHAPTHKHIHTHLGLLCLSQERTTRELLHWKDLVSLSLLLSQPPTEVLAQGVVFLSLL